MLSWKLQLLLPLGNSRGDKDCNALLTVLSTFHLNYFLSKISETFSFGYKTANFSQFFTLDFAVSLLFAVITLVSLPLLSEGDSEQVLSSFGDEY